MTIARRFILLLAVPLLVLVGLGIFTWSQLSDIEARSRFVAGSQVRSLAALGNISRSFAELRINLRSHLLATTPGQRTAARAAFDEDEKALDTLLRQYEDSFISGGRDVRLFGDYRASSRDYIIEAKRVMSLAEDGQRDEALTHFYRLGAEVGARLSKASTEWIQWNEDLGTRA